VEIALPTSKLQWLRMPSARGAGSAVRIYNNGSPAIAGRLIKLLPDLDQNGLMARLLENSRNRTKGSNGWSII